MQVNKSNVGNATDENFLASNANYTSKVGHTERVDPPPLSNMPQPSLPTDINQLVLSERAAAELDHVGNPSRTVLSSSILTPIPAHSAPSAFSLPQTHPKNLESSLSSAFHGVSSAFHPPSAISDWSGTDHPSPATVSYYSDNLVNVPLSQPIAKEANANVSSSTPLGFHSPSKFSASLPPYPLQWKPVPVRVLQHENQSAAAMPSHGSATPLSNHTALPSFKEPLFRRTRSYSASDSLHSPINMGQAASASSRFQPYVAPGNSTIRRSSSPSLTSAAKMTAEMDEEEKRQMHNDMERDRRASLKGAIISLKYAVPSMAQSTTSLTKLQIVKRAVEYITQLRQQNRQLQNQVASLQQRLQAQGDLTLDRQYVFQ